MSRQQPDQALGRAADTTRMAGGANDAPSPFADIKLKNSSSNTNNVANVQQNQQRPGGGGHGVLPYVLPYIAANRYSYPYGYNPYYYGYNPYVYPGGAIGNYAPPAQQAAQAPPQGVDPAILAALAQQQQPQIAQTGGAVITTPVIVASAFFLFASIALVFYIKNRHKSA